MSECKHVAEARKDLGTKERMPDGTLNPKVRAYFKHTKFPAKLITVLTAWCAAFACACLERSGIRSPRTARAADFRSYGTPVALDDAEEGDLLILDPFSPDAGGSGHVNFFVGWQSGRGSNPLGIGGNQDNGVSIKEFPRKRVVAVRRPPAAS